MLPVVPYELEEIKNELKKKAIEEFGLLDAEFEGSNVSQLINLLAYSTLVNNTNLTYGLNEMFITQATDRKNIIKHARQMGYTHKRKLSYQYKIKLKAIQEGPITIPKYTNFSSNGNNYVYLGDDITDTYGTNVVVKDLINEYNNGASNLYTNLVIGDRVISEDGVLGTVLDKSRTGENRLLLKSDDDKLFQELSENFTQDIYVEKMDPETGLTIPLGETKYRSFDKVGSVDTFLKDESTGMFKVQITLENGINFPIYTELELNTSISNNKLTTPTSKPIKFISEITLTKDGQQKIEVDIHSLNYIKNDINSTFIDNVEFPAEAINASELHNNTETGSVNDGVNDGENFILTTREIIKANEFYDVVIDFGSGSTKTISVEDLLVDYATNKVTIPLVTTSKSYINDNTNGDAVDGGIINVGSEIESVKAIYLIDSNSDRTSISESNYVFNTTTITLKDSNGDTDLNYDDGYSVEVDYVKKEDLSIYPITLNYAYNINLDGYSAKVLYSYDKGEDGYLDRRFYFSDLRGEYKENEIPKPIGSTGPSQGWKGFYASDFDPETNVLYFDVSRKYPNSTTDFSFHNEYVQLKDPNTNALMTALPLDKVMVTPFRKTRLFKAEYDNTLKEYVKVPGTCFTSFQTLSRKNEVELIVKEGVMKRHKDKDEDGEELLYPELTIAINESMVAAGHFTIFAPDVEHNGIELFVTRIMPDGSIEYDMPWNQRDYLLAEHTNVNQSAPPVPTDYGVRAGITNDEYDAALALWQRERVEETFTVMSDLNYEDYINIYTKYAGTGVALTQDMTIKINILDSSGANGKAGDLITPIDQIEEAFEAKYYIDDSFTPYIVHAEGTDKETTESIREHAPEFSNTSNRAVTKNDYKTICEAQPFIASAQVWGGEEVPRLRNNNVFTDKELGNIYFSIIPYSKPYTFSKVLNKYSLDNIYDNEFFFPTYTQITGKESYTENENNMKNNKNILFSILENYKIITLQLNYEKVIYMDMEVNVDVLKYKFGQTVIETNDEIFKSVKSFMIKEIEQFGSTFYLSSLIRHVDSDLGDGYGLVANIAFSVDLYDSYLSPELGVFKNVTKAQLSSPEYPIESPVYKGINYPGYNDDWIFEMPISMPIQDLFAADFVTEAGIIERGNINLDNITNIDTDNFIMSSDKLYMPLFHSITGEADTTTFKSFNRDLIFTGSRPTSASEVIEIPILYKTSIDKDIDLDDGYNTHTIQKGTVFKVGSYTINKSEDMMVVRINTHAHNHILNPRIYINAETRNVDISLTTSMENIYIAPSYLDVYVDEYGTGNDTTADANYYEVIEAALPREYFMNTIKTMRLNSKNQNISSLRNVYPRLKSVEFTSN